jgi:hypothetical protein
MCQRFGLLLVFASLLGVTTANAQSQPPSDPQAVALAAQSMAAMTGGTAITDVTLTGNVTSISGSETQAGTGTFLAKGASESRIDLTLNGGNRSDIRNGTSGFPEGTWAGSDGVSNAYASQNCWTDAGWFFPAFSWLSGSDPAVVLSYVGLESRSGASVQHIRSYRYVPDKNSSTTTLLQQQSTIDFYLDASSSLPVAISFNVHPDDDSNVNFSVEVDFSNYQLNNGAQIPMRIQRYLQGGLVLDLVVTGVSLNSGLPDSDFTIQ